MNITEMIKQLEELRDKYGDLPCYMRKDKNSPSWWEVKKLEWIKFNWNSEENEWISLEGKTE